LTRATKQAILAPVRFFNPTTRRGEMLQVYFAGAMTNLLPDIILEQMEFFRALGAICEQNSASFFIPDLRRDIRLSPQQVWGNAYNRIAESNLLVADVTYPSTGVGENMMFAWMSDVPVLALQRKSTVFSRQTRGNPAISQLVIYENRLDACRQFNEILQSFHLSASK
jgi:hypothetical protein